jgi:hypothetical protein
LSPQENIGKAIEDLKLLYPSASAAERADMVFDHIGKYGAPPYVFSPSSPTTNGTVAGKSATT